MSCICMYDLFKSFLFTAPGQPADGREEYIRAGLPESGRGVARIEPRARRWRRDQHYGSAGILSPPPPVPMKNYRPPSWEAGTFSARFVIEPRESTASVDRSFRGNVSLEIIERSH